MTQTVRVCKIKGLIRTCVPVSFKALLEELEIPLTTLKRDLGARWLDESRC